MIVPANRLLFWTAMLLPFAILGALMSAAAWIPLTALACLGAIAVGDAAIGRGRAQGVAVTIPDVIRMSKDRECRIPVRIRTGVERLRELTVGLPLPLSVRSASETVVVGLPADSREATIEWRCVPAARGVFAIKNCHFEVPSPLGFWGVRAATACRSELRVYPNLRGERRDLASLFLNRGSWGLHAQRLVGEGREFEQLRDYIPGDSYDDIHWKAMAKRARPVTKLFQVERTHEVYVAIDTSRLSARKVGSDPVLERFLSTALLLGLVAERQGDLFGVLSFSGKVNSFIRAGNGGNHYNSCRDALYLLESESANPDFEELFSFIRLRLRRRALIVILTDLDDPIIAENFTKNMEVVCRRHVVLTLMIRQPGTAQLFSSPDADSVDALYGRLSGHIRWSKLRELQRTLRRRGVELGLVDKEDLSTELVTRYMNIRGRQLL